MNNEAAFRLLPFKEYVGSGFFDPIRWYYWPILGKMYRRRVQLCLNECRGGDKVLEIGFGTGLTFFSLAERYDEIHGLDLNSDVVGVTSLFREHGIYPRLRNGNAVSLPYEDSSFQTVLLISILEHLQPKELAQTFSEIRRVLRKGGQVVYGVPVERPLMNWAFRFMGHDVRQMHFSSETQIAAAAREHLQEEKLISMDSIPAFFGQVYEIGHFIK